MNPSSQAGSSLPHLFALFPPTDYLDDFEFVARDEIPEPYRRLLVHEHHMTVTIEAHYGDLVEVQVLDEHRSQATYARKILLTLQKSKKVVQFGLMQIQLGFCSEAVREEILSRRTPLGRILIEHNVLRRIEPTAFLRVIPGPAMMEWFALNTAQLTYGRLALIHCDHKPAVELLEIVAPA